MVVIPRELRENASQHLWHATELVHKLWQYLSPYHGYFNIDPCDTLSVCLNAILV